MLSLLVLILHLYPYFRVAVSSNISQKFAVECLLNLIATFFTTSLGPILTYFSFLLIHFLCIFQFLRGFFSLFPNSLRSSSSSYVLFSSQICFLGGPCIYHFAVSLIFEELIVHSVYSSMCLSTSCFDDFGHGVAQPAHVTQHSSQ